MHQTRYAPILLLLIFVLAGSISAWSQIPKNANKTDKAGKRQGTWTILFDQDFKPLQDQGLAVYYRIITYKNDKPVGKVRDYYRSGAPQFEAIFLADRPDEVFDGKVTWYREDGSKQVEVVFENGKRIGEGTVFYTDNSPIAETADSLLDLGMGQMKLGNIKETLVYFKKAKVRAEFEVGQGGVRVAICDSYLAFLYTNLGDYEKAEPLQLEAKEIFEKQLGKENPNYATALASLANTFQFLDKYDRAEPLYIELLAIKAKASGTETAEYATSLNNLSQLYKKMALYEKAEAMNKQALGIRERVLGKQHKDYAESLSNLGSLYMELGEYSKAEPLYLEARDIREKVLGKNDPVYATTLSNLGQLYADKFDFSKAEPLFLEALKLREVNSGKETSAYATSLNGLGTLYFYAGNYKKAEAVFAEATETMGKVLGKNHPLYASALSNLALVYEHMGDYEKAETLYLESMQIRITALGKEHPDYALTLNNLGSLYKAMGNYQKAEALLIEARDIQVKVVGKDNKDYALALNNLAILEEEFGKKEEAEALYLEAKDVYAKTLGKEHPDYATTITNLGMLEKGMGQTDKAEGLYLEALAIRAKVPGKKHPDYANSLNNLAILYNDKGELVKSEQMYLEAKEIFANTLGVDHPDYANVIHNLAEFYRKSGNTAKADAYYQESVDRKQKEIVRYFPSLSEKEKQEFYSSNKKFFSEFEDFCVERAPENPAMLNAVYDLRLATKGLLFNASNKLRLRILNSGDAPLIEMYYQWLSKKDFLAKVYPMSPAEKLKKGIDEKKLEEEVNTIEKQLSVKSELFGSVSDTRLYHWRDVQQRLKPGEAAIELVRTVKNQIPIYAALILTSATKAHPEIVVLENGTDLEKKFSKYYLNSVKGKMKDVISYEQFWKPIAEKTKGIKKIYFSADGVYNQISLNTLFNPATGKFLGDEVEIQLVTSTKDLVVNAKKDKRAIKDATLFGFPDYNNSKPSVGDTTRSLAINREFDPVSTMKRDTTVRFFNGESIAELPGTKKEVETIAGLLQEKKITWHEFMFDRATESEMKKLQNPQVLHIATHGFFLADVTGTERGFAGIDAKKIMDNPLLRSGLLFAGARDAFDRTKTNATAEDGILSAYEAMNLNLDKTDLVVMSACETGLGVSSNGEGVYGLQRAFQVAGAKSVLMSLWTVSDEATEELMTMFYQNWLAGKSIRESFNAAQRTLRAKYPDPYYWGAFVMVGM